MTGDTPSPVAGPARVRSWPGAGSTGPRRRLRLWANCAFGQRFLANSPAGSGSARPRPGVSPLAPRPPLNAADLGHSPRYAIPACARGRSRDPPPERLCPRPPPPGGAAPAPPPPPLHAAGFQGLVTAHARVPRQRSSPTRVASLGLGLPSALSMHGNRTGRRSAGADLLT